jgi:diguanylate cyclase (GGDEF)-like protein
MAKGHVSTPPASGRETDGNDARLQALARLNDIILSSPSNIPFQQFADGLGPASGATRVYACTSSAGLDGTRLMNPKAEWCRDGTAPANASLDAAAYGHVMPKWEPILARGKSIEGAAGDFSGTERSFCNHRRAEYVRILPLIVEDVLFGILGLEYDAPPTNHSDAAFLKSAASLLTQALRCVRAQELAQQFAIRDTLTGLYNRKYLEDSLSRMDAFSKRYARPMGVLWIDLDHFKDINDSLGHSTGDNILAEFADLLGRLTRASDVVARYGGDEFIVVLPEASNDEASLLAGRILEATRAHLFRRGEKSFHITVSIGVASNEQDVQGLSCRELIANADEVMYRAKQKGRDQCVLWTIAGDLEETRGGAKAATAVAALPAGKLPGRTAAPRVLVVDDEPSVTAVLDKILSSRGYDVVACNDAQMALAALRQQPAGYDIVLSDISLPGMDGLALIEEVQRLDGSVVCVVITGHATADQAISALRRGAYDFVQKPFVIEQFHAVINRAMEHRRLVVENLQSKNHLQEMVREKSEEVLLRLDQLKTSYQFTLETMAAMLDAREHGMGRHSIRVRDLTTLLARHIGIKSPELDEMARGALVHDIGKIGIPDTILNKPGPLSPEEWTVMKKHPEIGYRFLESSSFLRTAAGISPPLQGDVHIFSSFVKTAATIVLSHHEKFDGSGYPRGLKGDQISLGARIFSVIDAYDAMRSTRVYRKSMSVEKSVEEITRCSGTHFDPAIVKVFLEHQVEIEQMGQWSETQS